MEIKGNFIVQGSYIDIHDNEVVNLSVDKAEVKVNGKTVSHPDISENPTLTPQQEELVHKLEAHFDKDMTMQVVDTKSIENDEQEEERGAEKTQENEALTRNQLLFNTHEEQREWAEVFVAFLKKHKMMDPQGLTKRRDSYINRALACFMHEWQAANILKVGHIDKAPSYFLFHSCNIRGIKIETHGNDCKYILKDCFEKERNSELHIDVSEVVKENM